MPLYACTLPTLLAPGHSPVLPGSAALQGLLRLTCVELLEGHAHQVVGLEELPAEGGVAAAHPGQGVGAHGHELGGGVCGGRGLPHCLDELVWYS